MGFEGSSSSSSGLGLAGRAPLHLGDSARWPGFFKQLEVVICFLEVKESKQDEVLVILELVGYLLWSLSESSVGYWLSSVILRVFSS